MGAPRIACVDLDAFFVSVERLLDPGLAARPVIVGEPGWRGVVASASSECRALGVRSGMSIAEARRLAPHAAYRPPRRALYREHAARVREILGEGGAVSTAGADAFFVDLEGDPDGAIERRIRELRDRIGLPASAGVARTRAVAEMASRSAESHGVLLIPAGAELAFVAPQEVGAFPGLGPVAAQALIGAGVRTLGDLLALPPGPLRTRFGWLAVRVRRAIDGVRIPAPRARSALREPDPAQLLLPFGPPRAAEAGIA